MMILKAPFSPIYAIVSVVLLIIVADLLRRCIPFYRRELKVEAATRLTPLDGLRGILCFSVMFHHASITRGYLVTGRWETPPTIFYALLGQSSVALFFCITGFLFWSRALARDGELPPWQFLRGRVFRIAPLYWFACAVALWIMRKQIHWSHRDSHIAFAHMAAMGMYGWGAISGQDVNITNAGVTHTLLWEWAFYLALVAVAPVARGGGGWRVIFIFLGLKILNGLDDPPEPTSMFLVGIIAAHVARWSRTATVLRSFYVAIVVMAIGISMPFFLTVGQSWLAVLLTMLFFVPIACGNTLMGILTLPGLRMMGMVSYSVYLLHGFILYTNRPLLQQMLAKGNYHYWLTVFALACGVLVGCAATYRFIEWPAIWFEKRLRRTPV